MKIGTGRTFISIFILCITVALPITRVGSFGEAAAMRVVRQGPPPGPLKFEVASIKPSKAGEPQTGGFLPGGRYSVTGYPLRALIAAAYLRPQLLPDFLIKGGPDWIDSERFNVEAKAANEFPAGLDSPSAPRRVMLQALLADRFKLRVHHETQEGNIYALTFAKTDKTLGPQLRRSSSDCTATTPVGCSFRIGPGLVSFTGVPMAQLIGLLPRFLDRMVVDATGLISPLDITLSWTPGTGEWVAPPMPGTPPVPPRDGPSLFTALQEQLALKLESKRGPIDVLIIESVDRLSEN